MIAARNFLAIHPQANLAIDATDVIVIPLTKSFAQILPRVTAAAVWRCRRERLHFAAADRKDIAIGREPGRFLLRLFLVLLGVTVIEHLHFDPPRERRVNPFFKVRDRFRRRPNIKSRVPAFLEMPPLRDHFEIGVSALRPQNADGLAGAMNQSIGPGKGARLAIDVGEIFLSQFAPPRLTAVNSGFGKRVSLLGAAEQIGEGEKGQGK